jgi:LPS sulfotransferase NodH
MLAGLLWAPREERSEYSIADPGADQPRARLDRVLVIASTPRSGSSHLASLLRSSRRAGDPREYLNPAVMRGYELVVGHPSPSVPGRGMRLARRLFGRAGWELTATIPRRELSRYLQHLVRTRTSGSGVWAIKVHWPQFQGTFLRAGLDLSWFEVPCAVVHLVRDDKLAQACSLVRASQTGLWSSDRRLGTGRQPTYDQAEIARSLVWLRQQDETWSRYFAASRIAPLTMSYESLVAAQDHEVGRALALVGQHPGEGVTSHLRRQADEVSDAWIERFRRERPDLADRPLTPPPG